MIVGLPHLTTQGSLEISGANNRKMINPRMDMICIGIGAITPVAPGTNTPQRLTANTKWAGIRLIIPILQSFRGLIFFAQEITAQFV